MLAEPHIQSHYAQLRPCFWVMLFAAGPVLLVLNQLIDSVDVEVQSMLIS